MRFQKLFIVFIFSFALFSLSLLILQLPAQANALPDTRAVSEGLEQEAAAPARLSTANLITVTTTADVIDLTDSMCSLREAIISANENPLLAPVDECNPGRDDETDRIVLADGATYELTIDGLDVHAELGDLDISANAAGVDVEIIVAGGGTATIDAQAINDRILDLFDATVSVTGVIFRNGSSSDEGGAIKSGGILTLTDSSIVENQADYGGGISNSGDALTLINTSILKNEATYDGGGIYNNSGDSLVRLIQSQVRANTTGNDNDGGGGIYNGQDGLLLVQDSVINLNKTGQHGGGIHNYSGIVTITNSLFEGNKTLTGILGGSGGAIYNANEGQVTVISATFDTANTANNGGAIFNDDPGTIILEGSLLEDNEAVFQGGAIFNRGSMTLRQTTVQTNQAATHGGGIYNTGGMTIEQQSNLYHNQAAGSGGGFYQSNVGLITVLNSSLISNTSATDGGGGYLTDGSGLFINTTIGGNSAGGNGGGIYVGDAGAINMLNVTVARNTAPAGAGLYQTANGSVSLGNSIVSAQAGLTCLNSIGLIDSFGHNLFRDDTCLLIIHEPGDLVGLDPQLSELAEANGTYFYGLQASSPARDAGHPGGCIDADDIDQVGTPRPIGPVCDIGAIEGAAIDEGEGPDDGPGGGDEPTSQIFLPLVIK